MILDSSALLAILKGERERDRFSETILNESSVAISAPTLLEVALVIEGQTGDKGRRDLDELVVEIDPADHCPSLQSSYRWRAKRFENSEKAGIRHA
jgi:uncharacterized protein with PIN domain